LFFLVGTVLGLVLRTQAASAHLGIHRELTNGLNPDQIMVAERIVPILQVLLLSEEPPTNMHYLYLPLLTK
jgi:hypothetical protein